MQLRFVLVTRRYTVWKHSVAQVKRLSIHWVSEDVYT